jgi:potassium-transporting ATPase KdpC subunit
MNWRKEIFSSVMLLLTLTVVTGIIYPLVITGLAQLFFPDTANGSLIKEQQKLIGSALIGQPFVSEKYFYGRPSASNYDGLASGGSNLGPTSQKLAQRIGLAVAQLHQQPATPIPVDLVTTSASGLDPHISPAAAEFQIARVARVRQLPEQIVRNLVHQHTTLPRWGILGEPNVNVLKLNLALDLATKPNK